MVTIHIRTIDGIEGPCLCEPDVFGDARGYFKETFRASLLDGLGVESFLQKRPAEFSMRVSKDLPDFYPWWDEPEYED